MNAQTLFDWRKHLTGVLNNAGYVKGDKTGKYKKLVAQASAEWHRMHNTQPKPKSIKPRKTRSTGLRSLASGRPAVSAMSMPVKRRMPKANAVVANRYSTRCAVEKTADGCKKLAPACRWLGGKTQRCQRNVGTTAADTQVLRHAKGVKLPVVRQSQAGGYWF